MEYDPADKQSRPRVFSNLRGAMTMKIVVWSNLFYHPYQVWLCKIGIDRYVVRYLTRPSKKRDVSLTKGARIPDTDPISVKNKRY